MVAIDKLRAPILDTSYRPKPVAGVVAILLQMMIMMCTRLAK